NHKNATIKKTHTEFNYTEDHAIMAWYRYNDPRALDNKDAYLKWIDNTSRHIKSLDSNHLVTIGSEGTTSSPSAGTDPERDHSLEAIDYQTIHIWVQNW